MIHLMNEFEKYEVGFGTERNKEAQLRKIEVQLKSGGVPKKYLRTVYNFLVGSLWIKFTPLQPIIHDCISAFFANL